MLESCRKHAHEMGVALCGRCGGSWCSSCIVYPFGPKKPPYCMSCAMVAGGVRSASTIPAMPRRQLKAQLKALKQEAKAAAKAGATAPERASEPQPELTQAASEPALTEAAVGETDWASPWWEDRQPTLAD
jgi:hypothetical protein